MSLESPPTENGGHNLSEIISGVLPGESVSAEDTKRLFAQRHGVHMSASSTLRNGSLTVRSILSSIEAANCIIKRDVQKMYSTMSLYLIALTIDN